MVKERVLNRYDIAKMIAAFLVVMRHSFRNYTDKSAILQCVSGEYMPVILKIISFNMPFFIFLSGVVYGINKQKGKYNDFVFVKNKAKRLLVPYIFLATFYVFPTLLILGMINTDNYLLYYIKSYVLAEDTRHLWYLPCLFSIAVLCNYSYGLITKYKILSIVFCIILFKLPCSFPYLINQFRHLLIYYILGILFSSMKFKQYNKKIELLLFVACFSLTTVCGFCWGRSILTGVLGIISFLYLSDMLTQSKRFINNGFVKSLSKNGFGIYLFHPMILYFLFYFNKDSDFNPYITAIVFGIIAYLISYGMSMFVKKYDNLKFIIGA